MNSWLFLVIEPCFVLRVVAGDDLHSANRPADPENTFCQALIKDKFEAVIKNRRNAHLKSVDLHHSIGH